MLSPCFAKIILSWTDLGNTQWRTLGGALAPPIISTETFILKSVYKYESQKEEYSQSQQHQNRIFLVKTNETILISQNKSYGCVEIE